MGALLRFSGAIDRATAFIGRSVMWLILLSMLVSAGNATSRKLFSLSSNAWLELQWYLFAGAYLLAAAYTLQRNDHIRIDIVSDLLPKTVTQLDRHLRPRRDAAPLHDPDDQGSDALVRASPIASARCRAITAA